MIFSLLSYLIGWEKMPGFLECWLNMNSVTCNTLVSVLKRAKATNRSNFFEAAQERNIIWECIEGITQQLGYDQLRKLVHFRPNSVQSVLTKKSFSKKPESLTFFIVLLQIVLPLVQNMYARTSTSIHWSNFNTQMRCEIISCMYRHDSFKNSCNQLIMWTFSLCLFASR